VVQQQQQVQPDDDKEKQAAVVQVVPVVSGAWASASTRNAAYVFVVHGKSNSPHRAWERWRFALCGGTSFNSCAGCRHAYATTWGPSMQQHAAAGVVLCAVDVLLG
jgi:hypothetical protein